MADDSEFAAPPPPPPKRSASDVPQPPPLKYTKPSWAGVAAYSYTLEVLKGGVSIDKIQGPKKDVITIGRLPLCDVQMEHPSISRYHAVLQFNEDSDAYIYDLESAHGTKLNKKHIPPRVHTLIRPGDQLQFGESTRIFVYETTKPVSEEDLEREDRIALRHRSRAADVEHVNEDDEDQGISWGFQEDAVEEDEEDEEDEENEASSKRKGAPSGDAALLTAETHDDLVIRKNATEKAMKELQEKIDQRKVRDAEGAKSKEDEEQDLDDYMKSLSKAPQKEASLFSMQKELQQLQKVTRL
ncbi:SMAD/FHA domain-containing protein [Radiomyces spectabilis]|uniref:SMAD/FHA domain-containing protein n=1 Tax=Radiomyces spectabilis TaxID=64574 RepID=UPI00221FCF9C|nr:SMAD/FHA domain-containing protein [Radiomyces spectabilis]KAI8369401.1 SMAD/FHA domain-containing protein [Radiomyces spectabilis]